MKIKTVIKRIIRKVGRIFYGRNVWLISDREDMAGDNGEALYLFLQNKPVKAFFAIAKDSPDYARLAATGKVVKYGSLWFHFLLCVADVHLSSHLNYMGYYKDTPHVFLQHGVTCSDISRYINSSCHRNFYIITSSKAEKNSFEEQQYRVWKDNILLTGFPRHDKLYNKPEKKITVSLTWREYLHNMNMEAIRDSQYVKAYRSILEDKELIDFLEQRGYTLYLKMHPMMNAFGVFDCSDKRVKEWESSYTDIFAKSDLLITDYSSIACDFALLRKPVIYYQFDEDTFWSGAHSLSKGYFDYHKDGFGEVVTTYEDLKKLIISYVDNACQPKAEYLNRVDIFFTYGDKNNSERVYNKVVEFIKKRT